MRGREPAVRRGMLVAAVLLGLAVGALALAAIEAAAMPIEGEGAVSMAQLDPGVSTQAAADDADAGEPVVDGLLDQSYTFRKYYTLTQNGPNPEDLLAPGSLYSAEGVTECYWAFVVDRGYNSNVYADNDQDYLDQDGWAGHGHTFKSLERSDHAEFDVTYNSTTFNIPWIDYLNADTNGSTAYASGEQTDGFGSGIQSPPLSAAATSLYWNLMNSGWDGGPWGDALTHSPPYTYNWTGNYWEWNLIYEFSIPRSVMGGQCGWVEQAGAHNSPSKQLQDMGFVGDRVWEDLNQDGIQDPDEPGVSGVLVYLINAQDGTTIRTTQTNPQGWYIFNNLPGGSYIVEFALPDGYQFTVRDQGEDDSVDSDPDPATGRTTVITLAPGTAQMTWDAGIHPLCGDIDVEKFVSVDGQQTWHDADEPPGPYARAGNDVAYRFLVRNTGYVTLTDVSLSDSVFDLSGCSVTSPLPPGGSFECFLGPTSAALGQHQNTATASGVYGADTYTDTDPAHYFGVDVRLDLVPDEDLNAVGDDHVFTATLEMNGGAGWMPLPGEEIAFTKSGVGDLSAGTCTTNDAGQCNVTLVSSVSGSTYVTATFDGLVEGLSFIVSDDAQKAWIDASITIKPEQATNGVGQEHVFTVTVLQHDGSGSQPVPGVSPTVSVVPSPDSFDDSDCVSGTDANGQCTVVINSTTVGDFTANATVTLTIGGYDLVRSTSGYSGPAGSGPAVKTYVDGYASIDPPNATNPVGESHTFTITVTALGAAPSDWVITPSVDPAPDSQSDTCDSPVVAQDGMSAWCTLTITSSQAGVFTATATADLIFDGTTVTVETDGLGMNSGPAIKNYVDSSLTIVKDAVPDSEQPFEFVRSFGDPFTLTDDGSGSNSVTFGGLSPGTYVVTETEQEGWDLSSIACTGEGHTVDFAGRKVTVTLGLDEDVICTFTNLEQQPAPPFVGIEVIKDVEPSQVEPLVPFTYTVEVRNTSWENPFDPLVLTDTLPTADFHYVAGSARVGGAAHEPDVVAEPLLVWNNLGNLPAGESITVTFAVTVPIGTEGTYTNTAVGAGHYVIEGEPGVVTDEDDAPVFIETTAVTLLYFRAQPVDEAVQLEWSAAAEWNHVGYYIYRAESLDFEDATPLTYVDAMGSGSTYKYMDEDVEPGVLYWYWLVDLDVNGVQSRSHPVSARVGAPPGQFRIFLPLVCRGP